ncbi:hypothetical protein [Caballeronia telluris]|uniref:hypothetical protein n=1 Tax=Caballeronia telluris TaxID=326475 RepID=UPI000F73E125|nr:hypothetical protein [Caballeronia telluris]
MRWHVVITLELMEQPRHEPTSNEKTNYGKGHSSLLAGPMAFLAGHVINRPDVQSVAILDYN